MKGFFSIFSSSARNLKDLRTLTTVGMLLAMAIAIRSLAIQITPDLRLVFTFIPMCVIGMLYGPVVCGMSTLALDLIGFIIDNKYVRGYSPQLALVVVLSGVIYGLFLYRDKVKMINIIIARTLVVLICNICLNSYFLYTLYINKDFSVFSGDEKSWEIFTTWLWTSFRLPKNLAELPLDLIILVVVLPAAMTAYKRVRGKKLAVQGN